MDEKAREFFRKAKKAYDQSHFKQAIQLYEKALTHLSKERDPLDYAATQNNLGEAHRNLSTGNKVENIERAMACYFEALVIYTKDGYPLEYAMTQNNLGGAYFELPTGNKVENIEQAIRCFLEALEIRTKDRHPLEYAATQNNLGIAYSELPTGSMGENIERAIGCFKKALDILMKDKHQLDYALTQNNLGNAYLELPTGDKRENIERAIRYHREALEVYTKDRHPLEYAMTQNSLGNACKNIPNGDEGENIEQAIRCYREALEIYTKGRHPFEYAMTQNSLGAAYSELPRGDIKENIERAIGCYREALDIYTKGRHPFEYAMMQNNLGNAYCSLSTGDKGENIKRAIDRYTEALDIFTKDMYPSYYAWTQDNLGNAYLELPEGDRKQNISKAIICHEEARNGFKSVGLSQEEEHQDQKIASLNNLLKLEQEKEEAEQRGDKSTGVQADRRSNMTLALTRVKDVLNSFGKTPEEREQSILGGIRRNSEDLESYLKKPRKIGRELSELVVLRRFNSYTPILSFWGRQSRGGGYFLIFAGKGLVIDPGFNFIQNFFEAGYSLADIDAVFVTHAHNDHTVDLESLVTLFYKRNKLLVPGAKKKIDLYLNRTSAVKYAAWLDLKRQVFNDIHVLNPGDEEIGITEGFSVKPVEAEHEDIVAGDGALGFLFQCGDRRIFFTGDSAYTAEFSKRCEDLGKIHLFIPHLGTLSEKEFAFAAESDEKKIGEYALDNHLGILGVLHLIQSLKPDLTLISEYGEELKGSVRNVIAEKITQILDCPTLAADVDLRVRIEDNHIKCVLSACGEYRSFEDIKAGYYLGNPEVNKLYYSCKEHNTDDVRNDLDRSARPK